MPLCSGLSAAVATAPNVVGTPSGTITLYGRQLSLSAMPFGGKIEDGVLQSTPWWQLRVVPFSGAPNVLLIIIGASGGGRAH